MDKFFLGKTKRELILATISFILGILILIYTIFSISFWGREINEAININLIKNKESVRFNFQLLEDLKRR